MLLLVPCSITHIYIFRFPHSTARRARRQCWWRRRRISFQCYIIFVGFVNFLCSLFWQSMRALHFSCFFLFLSLFCLIVGFGCGFSLIFFFLCFSFPVINYTIKLKHDFQCRSYTYNIRLYEKKNHIWCKFGRKKKKKVMLEWCWCMRYIVIIYH